jgi:rRNA maturation RNase YbeY
MYNTSHMSLLTITSTVKTPPPKLPLEEMKERILGKRYELSLAYVGETRARNLNQQYRNKTYTPNVLSFPLSPTAGEIIICPTVAKREAKKFNLTPKGYIGYLFIHGCLHLKGHDHGDTMDKLERKYLTAFKLS